MPDRTDPIVTQRDGWPAEWDIVPADRGAGVFRVDANGHWYHDGVRITHPGLVRLFAASVVRADDGELVLRWGPHDHPLTVADTAAVIHSVAQPEAETGLFTAGLVDGRTIHLDTATVWVGARHVLYARLPNGEPVRFSRIAYYQMATWIVNHDGGFAIVSGDRLWALAEHDTP